MAIYPSGSIINSRYEVVQGPREKPSLAGGMGLVYLCVDHAEDGRPVALKTFRPEYLPNREARDRFLREGSTWVELGYHPHIVRCYRVDKPAIGSEVFFVLQLIAAAEGKSDASLRAWLIPDKTLPLEQALLFALYIAMGMKHATTKIPGLVHRDLKPENILVGREGLARITDFGLARALGGGEHTSGEFTPTENGGLGRKRTLLTRGIAGTPRYMSPEQWAGETLDARSDIYALGCILYEMLKGEFVSSGQGPEEISGTRLKGLPGGVGELLVCCLSLKPEERFADWKILESRLGEIYEELTGEAAPAALESEGGGEREKAAVGYSYNAIGSSYLDIGKFSVARDCFMKVLDLAQEQQDRYLEGAALSCLGITYDQLGDFHRGIEFHEQHLTIARQMNDCYGEATALGNLGVAYSQSGDARRGIEFHEQHLTIAREMGDKYGEGTALGNLGICYHQLGDFRQAIGFYEQSLVIAREIGDRDGEGKNLASLGMAYLNLGEVHRSIEFYNQGLTIAQEIGDRHMEGQTLGSLGNAYRKLGDTRRTIELYEQSLAMFKETGDHSSEGKVLGSLGNAYRQFGDVHRAIEFYMQHLTSARECGNRRGEGIALGNLGTAYRQMGDIRRAIDFYERAMEISREIGDRASEGRNLGNLGNAYGQLRDAHNALKYYEQCLTIMREIGDILNEAVFSLNVAILQFQNGNFSLAQPHVKYALQVFTRAGHTHYIAKAQALMDDIKAQMK